MIVQALSAMPVTQMDQLLTRCLALSFPFSVPPCVFLHVSCCDDGVCALPACQRATGLSAPRVSARWEKEGHFSANDDKRKRMMLREAQAASAFNGGNPALNGLKRL